MHELSRNNLLSTVFWHVTAHVHDLAKRNQECSDLTLLTAEVRDTDDDNSCARRLAGPDKFPLTNKVTETPLQPC
jgi:hypothetical protein